MEIKVQKGIKVGAAVSGGVDSMVMLNLLKKSGADVVVINVEHGIRGALSKRDSNKVLTTIVDKENKPSIKLFSKICKPVESREIIGNTGKFWYFSSREMGKEN